MARRYLRLLEGIGAPELALKQPFRVRQTPTRFGRINMELTPEAVGWRLRFERGNGPAPAGVKLPAKLGGLTLKRVTGAASQAGPEGVDVEPGAGAWTAQWGA
ncbi:MAG: hypothetical protein WBL61_22250 [Bryobacteraceae bacterium]